MNPLASLVMGDAEELKAQGNVHFAQGAYRQAIACWTSALATASSVELRGVLHSNVSGAFCCIDQPESALEHAHEAVTHRPTWSKAHRRVARAQQCLGRAPEAFRAFLQALSLDVYEEGQAALETVEGLREMLGKLMSTTRSTPLVAGNDSRVTHITNTCRQLPALCCSICLSVLQRPVTHTCGCSADWHCVEHEATCPHCLQPWPLAECSPNFNLNAVLEAIHTGADHGISMLATQLLLRGEQALPAKSVLRSMLEQLPNVVSTDAQTCLARAAVLCCLRTSSDALQALQWLERVPSALHSCHWHAAKMQALILSLHGVDAWVLGLRWLQRTGSRPAVLATLVHTVQFLLSPSVRPEGDAYLDQLTDVYSETLHSMSSVVGDMQTENMDVATVHQAPVGPPLDAAMVPREELECRLCYGLLLEPVATPCGHVFCKTCLIRALDHLPACPFCRHDLREWVSRREFHVVCAIAKLVTDLYPDEVQERLAQLEAEESAQAQQAVPIFVCMQAWPGIPCDLHVFEPRYRLLMRRVLDSNHGRFGMCLPSSEGALVFGTLLQINEHQLTPDGRLFVQTTGLRRFRILDCSMKDGYWISRVDWVDDDPYDRESPSPALVDARAAVRHHIQLLRASYHWARIVAAVGQPPGPEDEDDARLAYWSVYSFDLCAYTDLEVRKREKGKERVDPSRGEGETTNLQPNGVLSPTGSCPFQTTILNGSKRLVT